MVGLRPQARKYRWGKHKSVGIGQVCSRLRVRFFQFGGVGDAAFDDLVPHGQDEIGVDGAPGVAVGIDLGSRFDSDLDHAGIAQHGREFSTDEQVGPIRAVGGVEDFG